MSFYRIFNTLGVDLGWTPHALEQRNIFLKYFLHKILLLSPETLLILKLVYLNRMILILGVDGGWVPHALER